MSLSIFTIYKIYKLKDLEKSPKIKIEENVEVHSDLLETPQFSSSSSAKKAHLAKSNEGLEKAEEELIAQVYNSLQEDIIEDKSLISTSVFNDSPRNFTYSESSNTGTPIQESPRLGNEKIEVKFKNAQRQIKILEDRIAQFSESVRSELIILTENFEKFDLIIDKNKRGLDKVVENIKESEKGSALKDQEIEKIISNLESRVLRLENSDENKKELDGLKNSYKDLILRVEKYELNSKLQVNSMKKSLCRKQEVSVLQEKHVSFNGELKTLTMAVNQIDLQVEKLKQFVLNLQRAEKATQQKCEEHDSILIDLKQKMCQIDTKYEDLPNFDYLTNTMQNHLENKFTRLELRVWDAIEADIKNDSKIHPLRTLNMKVHTIDEKLNSMFESLNENSKEILRLQSYKYSEHFEKLDKQISQSPSSKKITIPYKEKRILRSTCNNDNFRNSVFKNTYSGQRPSSCIRPSSSINISEQDGSYRTLYDKLAQTDTFSMKKFKDEDEVEFAQEKNRNDKQENHKSFADIRGYLPGEAESIVMSAIIEKANKSRVPQMKKCYSAMNLSPATQSAPKTQTQFPSFIEDISPSIELHESLKLRGIII